MKLYVKNMISLRCIREVKAELDKLKVKYTYVADGEIFIGQKIPARQLARLKAILLKCGFEVLDEEGSMVLEKVIEEVEKIFDNATKSPRDGYSNYFNKKINYNHTPVADLFTEVKGITIDQMIHDNKIEKVKEALVYSDLSLATISKKHHFTGVSHMSAELKKATGFSPSHFRQIKRKRRTVESLN